MDIDRHFNVSRVINKKESLIIEEGYLKGRRRVSDRQIDIIVGETIFNQQSK